VVFWEKHRREIFWDLDGSISEKFLNISGPAFLMPYKQHLDGLENCVTKVEDEVWDDSIIC
jgi:hypothetical protein